MNIFAISTIASAALLACTNVDAMPTFLTKIPNGSLFKNTDKWLGHTADGGYSQFGMDFISFGEWTPELCKLTYKGAPAGMTYGKAFGDPCCTWKAGATPQTITPWAEGSFPTVATTCASSPTVAPTPTTKAPTPTTKAPTPTTKAPAPTTKAPTPTTKSPTPTTKAPTPTTKSPTPSKGPSPTSAPSAPKPAKPATPSKRPGCKRTRRV